VSAVIVGGGIAGLAAASVLGEHMPVTVIDRGRRIGGRMGTTVLTEGPWQGHIVDLGAAYLTARDAGFTDVVRHWLHAGLLREWTDSLLVARAGRIEDTTSGPVRYASRLGLRALAENLASNLTHDVTVVGSEVATRLQLTDTSAVVESQGRFTATKHRYAADVVALCLPGPQAIYLLAMADPAQLPHVTASATSQVYQPIITLVAQWPERRWEPFSGCFVNDDPDLAFVADDGDRRGDGAAVLVAHSSHSLAQQHLGDPDAAAGQLVAALRHLFDIDEEPSHVLVRRWSLARAAPAHGGEASYALDADRVGLAGDAFSTNPRIEAAWLSGSQLANALLATAGAR
jgi:renalase